MSLSMKRIPRDPGLVPDTIQHFSGGGAKKPRPAPPAKRIPGIHIPRERADQRAGARLFSVTVPRLLTKAARISESTPQFSIFLPSKFGYPSPPWRM